MINSAFSVGNKIEDFFHNRPPKIDPSFAEVGHILFELEFYKKKSEFLPEHKLCKCYKIIYQNCLTLFGLIIASKAVDKKITLNCITEAIPYIEKVDMRAAILAYIFVKPILKDAISDSYNDLKNNIWEYVKETKLTLGGIHLNCEHLEMCSEIGECKFSQECGVKCPFHKNKHAVEYIRMYATDSVLRTSNRFKNILYWVKKFHKRPDDIWFIGDYKNLEHPYIWTKSSYKRFLLAKKFSNDKMYYINYENKVDFGPYYNEVRPYLNKEEDIIFLHEEEETKEI